MASRQAATRRSSPRTTPSLNHKALEELGYFLSPLKLPTNLTIHAGECGALRKPYDASSKTVTICYEEIARVLDVVGQQTDVSDDVKREAIIGGIVGTMLHETAYGLFDIYDVPIWGRVDDAADRLAAFVMTQFGAQSAMTTVRGMLNYLYWSAHTLNAKDFAPADSPEGAALLRRALRRHRRRPAHLRGAGQSEPAAVSTSASASAICSAPRPSSTKSAGRSICA